MLAKLWKKVLLAICIIACIFNIMSKLVNRHSLKDNLESANDGETVFSIFQKDQVVESESQPIIDGVMNPEPTTTEENNSSVTNNTEKNAVENNVVEVTTETSSETVVEDVVTEETITEEVPTKENTEKETFKFSDFTILF